MEHSTTRVQGHHSVEVSEPQDLIKSISRGDDDAVIAAPPEATHDVLLADMGMPAEIPPEERPKSFEDNEVEEEGEANDNHRSNNNNNNNNNGGDSEDDDWDDEDSYEYEDDDDVAFSGFLAPQVIPASRTVSDEPAQIIEEETPAEELESKRKWKEPTREAVSMSLRAQSESTGGKRRLALDLYKIMNQDTQEAGFSLQPKCEDSMDLWTIKLFQFDEDSNLAKDMRVLGVEHIELEMKFPDQYPFEPPFVRVVRPRFKRQTGFVMNGALCMELLTKDGWNPINDIESVIVSIRSLLVVGDGRLSAAADLSESRYEALLQASKESSSSSSSSSQPAEDGITSSKPGEQQQQQQQGDESEPAAKRLKVEELKVKPVPKAQIGSYSATEAHTAYSHLSDYHKKKGWDTSGWWARKG